MQYKLMFDVVYQIFVKQHNQASAQKISFPYILILKRENIIYSFFFASNIMSSKN